MSTDTWLGRKCSAKTKEALRDLLRSLKAQRARALQSTQKKYEAQLRAVERTMELMTAKPQPGDSEVPR